MEEKTDIVGPMLTDEDIDTVIQVKKICDTISTKLGKWSY